MFNRTLSSLAGVCLVVAVAACGGTAERSDEFGLSATPFVDTSCSGSFVAHDLDHVTAGGRTETSLFDGTGSGVAIEDLDGDGRHDVVLANLSGWSTFHRNEGGLDFERIDLIQGRFRQPAPIDIDADGALDLVFTTGIGIPAVLKADGDTFRTVQVPELSDVAYSIGWGDVDGDGDIDLATGSYNAELTAQQDFASVLGGNSGITFYERIDDIWEGAKLIETAQALVVRFHDVDGDGATDLMAGNDLATPDNLWLRRDGTWEPAAPFPQTTFSTMSMDSADIDNDGDFELYATDMHPMSDDAETQAAWEPVMEDMEAMPMVDEIQAMENVLLTGEGDDFESIGRDLGVPYTGWSWSGVFGDLDNDGFVDLYVVNGMESPAMFPNLPDGALVEENQVFRNEDGSGFTVMPDWGLGDQAGGRGMAMADLDNDGDLDIVVNNLNAPSRLFENQLCGGDAISIDLAWAGTQNVLAIGSEIEVETTGGDRYYRMVETNRGYLSSGPATAHVGLGSSPPARVTITWPDGVITEVEDVEPNTRLTVTR